MLHSFFKPKRDYNAIFQSKQEGSRRQKARTH